MNFMCLSKLLIFLFMKLEPCVDDDVELSTLYSLMKITSLFLILPSSFFISSSSYNSCISHIWSFM